MTLFDARLKHPHVYIITFPDRSLVVFKILRWDEFKAYRSLIELYGDTMGPDIQDDIFERCILDMSYAHTIENEKIQVDYESIPSGVVETVSNIILSLSGSQNIEKLFYDIDSYRDAAIMNPEQRILKAVSVINKLKPEDYDKMYWPDILNTVTQDELILANNIASAPFAIAEEQNNAIDFEKENKEDSEVNDASAINIIEQRKAAARERRKAFLTQQ